MKYFLAPLLSICPHVPPQGSEAPVHLGQPFPLDSTKEHVPECIVPLPHHIAVPTLIPEQPSLSLLCSVMDPTPSTHFVAFPLSAHAREILMPQGEETLLPKIHTYTGPWTHPTLALR